MEQPHQSQSSLFSTGAANTPPTTVMEKLLNSENNSTSNLNSVDASSIKVEDRLGGSVGSGGGGGIASRVSKEQVSSSSSSSVAAHNLNSSSNANTSKVNSLGVNSNNAGCSSSKRKMDFSSNSVNLTSSGIHSVNPSGSSVPVTLKRPILTSRDYENIIDDDLEPHQLLYDYSSEEAW